ncbi:MAG: BspA family leucine-rich repeat surface protein, partial [Flavobacteriaceae bacterium]
MRNNLIYILIFLLSGGLVFSQNITIDGNGTVKCPGQAVGYNETIGLKTYYVVNNAALIEFRDTGSFTVGGTTYTPANMSCVCTTRVTDMSSLFLGKGTFNEDISSWDTSNVTNMYELFRNANDFDQDLSTWDTSKVTNMSKMFDRAHDFNNGGNPSMFSNVSSVTTMFAML